MQKTAALHAAVLDYSSPGQGHLLPPPSQWRIKSSANTNRAIPKGLTSPELPFLVLAEAELEAVTWDISNICISAGVKARHFRSKISSPVILKEPQ